MNKFINFLRLEWKKVSIISAIVIISIATILLFIISLNTYFGTESYIRRMVLINLWPWIYVWLVIGTITGIIHTLLWMYFVLGGGFARLGAKKVKVEETNVHWEDVVGMEAVKTEVWEVIKLIKDHAFLKQIGGQVVKAVLLIGPPGVGKTYIAKAIATETGLPFLGAVGSEFIGIFVGQGAMSIKNLFHKARVLADIHGGCIVFIDEIDSIARPRRGNTSNIGAESAHNATINQLLTELDGLRQKEKNILVIAATNVPESELDPALLRSGRFDRKIYIDYPTLRDREKLLEYYLNKVQYDKEEIKIPVLARKTVGFSPADIATLVREASLICARSKRTKVSIKDISEAYDRVLFGLKGTLQLNEEEKIKVAYHEAGHAIIAYFFAPKYDVIKATLIPRKSSEFGYLGYASSVPREEIHILDKEDYLGKIKTSLGSYAAEKIKFGKTTSGVVADFQNAYNNAYNMVWKFGMGPSNFLGNPSNAPVSPFTHYLLDKDVQKILRDCLEEVENFLRENMDLLDDFAQQLLLKEELDYDEIVEIFRKHGKARPQDIQNINP